MSGYYARKADDSVWHSVSGNPDQSTRAPRCGALPWPKATDDAVRPVTAGGVFGPICARCAREEGL